jgi:lipoyl(octanoyl) transferase
MLLHCIDAGLVEYSRALAQQEELLKQRCQGFGADALLLLEHPPVYTMGRGGDEHHIRTLRNVPVHRVGRGGNVTFHGPGQLVGYPIIDLARHSRDVHAYLRALEGVLIAALAAYGLHAQRRTGLTGVWVGPDKIASIGIGVRRWITYHGFALNVEPDLSYFADIVPCGLPDVRMTSMAKLLTQPVALAAVRQTVAAAFASHLGYKEITWHKNLPLQSATRSPQSVLL